MNLFAQKPDQWDKLRENPDLIANAVKEAVRVEAPVRGWTRFVSEDTELAGQALPTGARVLVTLLYALRDRGKKSGIATLCIGGGEAAALAVELV